MKDKYKTLITACWLVLISCFIVKLLGGNWFEIACSNEKFIAFCNYCQTNSFLYYFISGINALIGNTLIIASFTKNKISNNKTTKFIIIYNIVIHVIKCLCNIYIPNSNYIIMLFDIPTLLIVPLIINKALWKRIIVGIFLVTIFQVISLITKNIGVKNIDDNILTTLIFMIDYYIMLILYYLYSLKEEQDGTIWCFISRFRKRRNH